MGERGTSTSGATQSGGATAIAARPRAASAWQAGEVAPTAGRVSTLAETRQRRMRWREAVRRLRAAESLAGDTDLWTWWREEIRGAAHHADAVLTAHVAATEGPDGLFSTILTDAPHTAGEIAKLCNDHAKLLGLSGHLRWLVERESDAPIHATAAELIELLEEHHHRGADVLHAAYSLDVGVGD